MKNNTDRVELRIENLQHAGSWLTAMVEVTDTLDNAVILAEKYLPNATAADIIKITEMLLARADRLDSKEGE